MKLAAEIILNLLLLGFALYSLTMIYALLRFGRSKILGLLVTGVYLIIIASLYSAVRFNFAKIVFPSL